MPLSRGQKGTRIQLPAAKTYSVTKLVVQEFYKFEHSTRFWHYVSVDFVPDFTQVTYDHGGGDNGVNGVAHQPRRFVEHSQWTLVDVCSELGLPDWHERSILAPFIHFADER